MRKTLTTIVVSTSVLVGLLLVMRWNAIMTAYHLGSLESDISHLDVIYDAEAGSAARQAIEQFIEDPDRKVIWLERVIQTEDSREDFIAVDAAVEQLGRIRTPASARAFDRLLVEEVSWNRYEKNTALIKLGSVAFEVIDQHLLSTDEYESYFDFMNIDLRGKEDLALLDHLSRHPKGWVRSQVAGIFWHEEKAPAIGVEILLRLARDKNYDVRAASVGSLASLGLLRDDVASAICDVFVTLDLNAMQDFGETLLAYLCMKAPDLSLLRDMVRRCDEKPRGALAEEIAYYSENLARPLVPDWPRWTLGPDSDSTKNFAYAIGAAGERGEIWIPEFLALLSHDEFDLRPNAYVRSLIKIGAASLRAVVPLLSSEDSTVRFNAIEVVGKLGDESHVVQLATILTCDPSDAVRQAAARALGSIGALPTEAIPVLVEALDDDDENIRREAANGLHAFPKLGALYLGEALSHEKEDVRRSALLHLGQLRPKEASIIDALATLVNEDENASLRDFGVLVLGRIGPAARRSLPTLLPLLNSEYELTRRWSVEAIGRIGGESAAAALISMRSDPEELVRDATARTLQSIRMHR